MLNLIIPYRHEREGYFKGLCILSGCTDSELTGHLGGCLAAAAALKAGLPNGNRITLHQCAPSSTETAGPGRDASSTETAGPGRDAQGRVTVKSAGRRHSPGPPVQPSHLLHLTLCRFWPARSRFHYPANGDSNSLAQSVGDKLS